MKKNSGYRTERLSRCGKNNIAEQHFAKSRRLENSGYRKRYERGEH